MTSDALFGGVFVLIGTVVGVLISIGPSLLLGRARFLQKRKQLVDLLRIENARVVAQCEERLTRMAEVVATKDEALKIGRIKVMYFSPFPTFANEAVLTDGDFVASLATVDLPLFNVFDGIGEANGSIERFTLFTETSRQAVAFVQQVLQFYEVLEKAFTKLTADAKAVTPILERIQASTEKMYRRNQTGLVALQAVGFMLFLAAVVSLAVIGKGIRHQEQPLINVPLESPTPTQTEKQPKRLRATPAVQIYHSSPP